MADHEIRTDRDGAVATIVMTNPPRHTMTAQMVRDLDLAVAALEEDEEVRVVVLTGGGDGVFIAHYEVGELAEAADRQQDPPAAAEPAPARALHAFNRVMRRLETMPKVTVAAINGNAAGGGFELALSCDFRLAIDGPYRLGLPETSVGIIPGAGGTQRIARLLGVAQALELILLARLLTPEQALGLGLVSRLFVGETFRAEVAAFAADLAHRAPIALAAAKEAIRAGADLPIEDGLLLEQDLFDRCMRSADAAGAMRAVLRREAYTFEGR